jgi:hypothetical protein
MYVYRSLRDKGIVADSCQRHVLASARTHNTRTINVVFMSVSVLCLQ